ncbi:hypothetical protein C8Q78DRAFT_1079393 [Trametes maxima]|nr:hypothetical protein C8Q78DRAFT_1079393 [Trametes maxima]
MSAHKHSTVQEAYTVLGLEQGTSLEVVKSTYKQLALKTHPDKNPGDTNATAQFQRLSEAYNVLLKQLDRSASPPRRPAHTHAHGHTHTHSYGHTHSHSHFNPFEYEYEFDDYDEFDEYDDYDDDYDDSDSDYFDHMAYYMFIYEELTRGYTDRHARARFQHLHRDQPPPETPEQYSARLRKAREAQEEAAERRARDEAFRKAAQEKEREQERREAEQRQRRKASAKKAEAEALRKNAEQKARAQQEQLQTVRSKTFAAARRKDAASVKKGVYEENVDAAGGEVRRGAEAFVKNVPVDPKETLMHIAAKSGDVDLVEWLGSHSAEAEERDGQDRTAFHVALQNKHAAVARYFFENYPPDDEDYDTIYRAPEGKSNLRIALDTHEPEIVWTVLDKHLHTQEEMGAAWGFLNTNAFRKSVAPAKFDEFVNLFGSFGGYRPSGLRSGNTVAEERTRAPLVQGNGSSQQQLNGKQTRRPKPTITVEDERSTASSPVSEHLPTPSSASPSPGGGAPRPYRGRGNRGRPFQPRPQQQSAPSSPGIEHLASMTPSNVSGEGNPGVQQFPGSRGRGRGRGRGQYRGRGRGRGQVPVA